MYITTYFQTSITVCITTVLLMTLSFMVTEVTSIENESDLERSFNIVESSVSEEEDAEYIRQVLDKHYLNRQTELRPTCSQDGYITTTESNGTTVTNCIDNGSYQLEDGDRVTIWSPNFYNVYPDNDYPNNAYQRWQFKPAPGAKLYLHCPIIRIVHAARCKYDRLTIFYYRRNRVRKGERRCGRINDYTATFDSRIKVTFTSDNFATNRGYVCDILCQNQESEIPADLVPPTTTTSTTSTTTTSTSTTSTTTTTFMPGCPQPVQSQNPKPVTNCSDLDPAHIGSCSCTECSGQLQLTCDICTLCDMDVFGTHAFGIPLNLEFMFSCGYSMSLSGYYGVNGNDVLSLTVCVTNFTDNVDIAFEDLTNLQAVAYRDCSIDSSSCIYDPCSPEDVCQSYNGSTPHQRPTAVQSQNSPITIDIPSVSLAGVKELYVADVCLDLSASPLAIESMEKLCINEASGCTEIIPNGLDCPNLQQVFINTCQSDIKYDTYNIVSPNITCLDIALPCTHNLDEKYIVLDELTCDNDVTVITEFNTDFYKYIPHCPYHEFILKGCIDIVFTQVFDCRECGNYWLGKITADQLSRVHGSCFDVVHRQNHTIQEYFTNETHPCDFIPLQTC